MYGADNGNAWASTTPELQLWREGTPTPFSYMTDRPTGITYTLPLAPPAQPRKYAQPPISIPTTFGLSPSFALQPGGLGGNPLVFGQAEEGPLRWTPAQLPLPCAYLRLPWPQGRSFARLLPSRAASTVRPAALAFRQFVKKMMVEEVCSSPPLYLMRYVHFAAPFGSSECKTDSRLLPFLWARKWFPALQALALQRWVAERPLPLPQPGNKVLFASELVTHCLTQDEIYTTYAKLPNWNVLPLNYKEVERAFVESDAVTRILDQLSTAVQARRKSVVRRHLVVTFDVSGHGVDWTPHNMRQVVHLVAQTVSVLSSVIPLFLEPQSGAMAKTSHAPGGFASFQILLFPPRKFNQGVSSLRVQTPGPTPSLPLKDATIGPPFRDDSLIDSDSDDTAGQHHQTPPRARTDYYERRRLLSPAMFPEQIPYSERPKAQTAETNMGGLCGIRLGRATASPSSQQQQQQERRK